MWILKWLIRSFPLILSVMVIGITYILQTVIISPLLWIGIKLAWCGGLNVGFSKTPHGYVIHNVEWIEDTGKEK